MIELNKIILGDCHDIMPLIPEMGRDVLAVVDPPYGIGEDGKKNHSRGSAPNSNKWKGSKNTTGAGVPSTKFKIKEWDNSIPDKAYFDELLKVSKNQIIWGGNYFIDHLKNTSCFIVWDKVNGTTDFADAELAWTSFETATRIYKFMWNGMLQGNMRDKEKRIHPTQKPIALYRWLLQNYAKPGQLILDTHSGSGSLACACHLEKFDFIAIEKDPDYHRDSVKRLDELRSQGRLF